LVICLKPDDGTHGVWLIANDVTGHVEATFLKARDKCEMKLHSCVGTTYWTSKSIDFIFNKWQAFKEANKSEPT